jgi:hypothetical protein
MHLTWVPNHQYVELNDTNQIVTMGRLTTKTMRMDDNEDNKQTNKKVSLYRTVTQNLKDW